MKTVSEPQGASVSTAITSKQPYEQLSQGGNQLAAFTKS